MAFKASLLKIDWLICKAISVYSWKNWPFSNYKHGLHSQFYIFFGTKPDWFWRILPVFNGLPAAWALLSLPQWAELYWEREPDLLGSRVIFHFSYWENFFPLDSVVLWCRWESIGAIFRVTCIFLSFLIPIHTTVELLNPIHFRYYPILNLNSTVHFLGQ